MTLQGFIENYGYVAVFVGCCEHAKQYEAIAFSVLAVLVFVLTWIGKVLRRPGSDGTNDPRPNRR